MRQNISVTRRYQYACPVQDQDSGQGELRELGRLWLAERASHHGRVESTNDVL